MVHTIALAGNPNSRKTTLFNALTGARQQVGNYPGVTVEKKTGVYKIDDREFSLVDLPATYSLEEVIARDFIATEKPAVVVDIVDAANLERNLYLTLQIIEMGVPVCIALNMMDVAKSRGVRIEAPRLSALLGEPVVPTVARNGTGKKELMAAAAKPHRLPTVRGVLIHAWERTWQYIRKAGTVILAISILLWALMSFPGLPADQAETFGPGQEAALAGAELRHSVAGRIGTSLEPVTELAGFDWRTNIALVGGFAAKEVIVSTLGTAYSMGETDAEAASGLSQRLAQSPQWKPLTAFALIVFVMFYSPCFVAVVCIAREAGSWKWAVFSMAFNTVLAFVLAVSVYQAGSLLGLG
jgi:Fe2+ transport system protein B